MATKTVAKGEATSLDKARRARAKARKNREAVEEMNAREAARLPGRLELIEEARALGVPGTISRMKVKDLAAAIELKKALAVTPQHGDPVVAKIVEKMYGDDEDPVTGERPSEKAMRLVSEQEKAAKAAQVDAAPASTVQRSKRGPRGIAARAEAKRLGKRGPGEKVTDDQLARYVANVRKQHPESSASDEMEQAYWVEKLAVSTSRFMAAWEAADPK